MFPLSLERHRFEMTAASPAGLSAALGPMQPRQFEQRQPRNTNNPLPVIHMKG